MDGDQQTAPNITVPHSRFLGARGIDTFLAPECRKPCLTCPYKSKRVGTRGRIESRIVFVGESPGKEEHVKGRPFSGDSGTLLWGSCPYGETDDVFVTNSMQCSPTDKSNEKKAAYTSNFGQAVRSCHDRLMAEINAYPRRVIVAMGNAALWTLTGNYGLKITQERGRIIPSPLAEVGILPVVHPAAILRGTGSYRKFKEDIHYAFDLGETGKVRSPITPDYEVATDPERVLSIGRELADQPIIAADTETSSLNKRTCRIIASGFAYQPHKVFVVPRDQTYLLAEFAAKKKGRVVWHNGGFDVPIHQRYGVPFNNDEDTMLLSYAGDENTNVHKLEQISSDVLGSPNYKHLIKQWVKKKSDSFELIPLEFLYKYRLSLDVSGSLQVFNIYRERIRRDPALEVLYTQTLLPYSEVLWRMEMRGLYVDMERVQQNRDHYAGEVERVRKKIQDIAGYPINPNAPAQMAELMFDRLGIMRYDGDCTDKNVLAHLPDEPIVIALREYRKLAKAWSTYAVGVPNAVEDDGCIHTSFKQIGTKTGRLSSTEPNVQNIPREERIRGMFIARPGRKLLEVDLNQAELRSLAELSGDAWMIELYNNSSRSLHKEMSDFLFPGWFARGGDFPGRGNDEYMRAKAVNFGIPYGRTEFSIAEEFNIDPSTARQWVQAWFQRAPGAEKFIKACRTAAISAQNITTTFGRKKRHVLVTRSNIQHLCNEAANFPHQSISHDIISHVACAVSLPNYPHRTEKLISELDTHIILDAHDALLFDIPDDMKLIKYVARMVIDKCIEIPRYWGLTKVPFTADAKLGVRWGGKNMEKFDPYD